MERHYITDPGQLELLPGAGPGLQQVRVTGLVLVAVTNQSAAGRRFTHIDTLGRIDRRVCELFERGGEYLDGIYFCDHPAEDRCSCREPSPSLLEVAGRELGIEPRSDFVIGDQPVDIRLGQRKGATTLPATG